MRNVGPVLPNTRTQATMHPGALCEHGLTYPTLV